MIVDTERLPARPESVADWEDLLVRFEIMPRVVRVTLEDVGDEAQAEEVLMRMIDREARAAEWLNVASGGSGSDVGGRVASSGAGASPLAGIPPLVEMLTSRRARNFAMLQRRGLQVWDWRADSGSEPAMTAYQLVAGLVASDARELAALRALTIAGEIAC
jgi:hypothetical protein